MCAYSVPGGNGARPHPGSANRCGGGNWGYTSVFTLTWVFSMALSLPAKRQLLFSVYMGLMMTLIITGILTAVLTGLDGAFLARWMRAFIIAFVVAVPIVFLAAPRVRASVDRQLATPAEAVAQGQLDAYNARDIDAFMRYWAEDAEIYEFPDKLLATGSAAIRERHIARFTEANLHGRLMQRMVMGNRVVDRETVTRTFPEGTGRLEVTALYEIEGGKIAKAWFMMGAKTLDTGS